MIILSAEEADKVRGRSPSVRWAALEPVPLKDGTFMLPEDVLADPAHADVAGLLKTLPVAKEQDLAAMKFDFAKPADVAAIADMKLPKWSDVGVRADVAVSADAAPIDMKG